LISTRSLVVNILGEDYLTYAQARGLKNRNILTRIVLRNTWLPQIAGLGISLGGIVGGNVLIENLFRYPGVGTLMVQATALKDVNTMMACLTMMIILVLTANLIIDLLLPFIDPRVKRA
jgi:peptide/nickel transport system permease protein